MKKLGLIFSFFLMSIVMLSAQSTTAAIDGTVTDVNGDPMVNTNVTIVIYGCGMLDSIYATTDANGYYFEQSNVCSAQATATAIVYCPSTGQNLAQTGMSSSTNWVITLDFACGTSSACLADFIWSASPSGAITFNSSITGGIAPYAYSWDFGDGNTSTLAFPTHTYTQAGTYNVCLTVTDANGDVCTHCSSVMTSGTAQCTGWLIDSPQTNLDVQFILASPSGVGPFSYAWDFGDGNTSTLEAPLHTYASAGSYNVSVTVTDANGDVCDYSTTTYVGTNNSISGSITADNGMVYDATVYLISAVADPVTGDTYLTLINSTTVQQGWYMFDFLPDGDYLVKAALNMSSSVYADYVPTYFTNSLDWNNATTVSFTPSNSNVTANINLIAGTNPGGAGFVGGWASQGANFGPGDPIAGMLVMLINADGDVVAYDVSGTDGKYSFPNIPYGTYTVHGEVLGKTVNTGATIVISANTPSVNNVVVEENSTYIVTYIDGTTGTQDLIELNAKLLANPFNDATSLQLDIEEASQVNLTISNVYGQVVKVITSEMVGQNTIQIDLSNESNGLYFLNVEKNSQSIGTLRLIKQ